MLRYAAEVDTGKAIRFPTLAAFLERIDSRQEGMDMSSHATAPSYLSASHYPLPFALLFAISLFIGVPPPAAAQTTPTFIGIASGSVGFIR